MQELERQRKIGVILGVGFVCTLFFLALILPDSLSGVVVLLIGIPIGNLGGLFLLHRFQGREYDEYRETSHWQLILISLYLGLLTAPIVPLGKIVYYAVLAFIPLLATGVKPEAFGFTLINWKRYLLYGVLLAGWMILTVQVLPLTIASFFGGTQS